MESFVLVKYVLKSMYFYKERKEIGPNFANQDIMDTYMQRIIYLAGIPRSHTNHIWFEAVGL
jgi:hypothetical protein